MGKHESFGDPYQGSLGGLTRAKHRHAAHSPAVLLLGAIVLLCLGCDGWQKDQVRRLTPAVWAGLPASNPPALNDNSWQELGKGAAVRTDAAGEAELELVGCNGTLYVFQGTLIKVSACRKADAASGSATCGLAGTAYYNIECTGRYIVDTPSGRILIQGTAFSVTFLPERLLTLVTVFEGRVTVQPVIDPDTDALGPSIVVTEGHFLYTMPDEFSSVVGGLPPRQSLPVEQMPPLINELGIRPWMESVVVHAKREGVLHQDLLGGGKVVGPGSIGPDDLSVKPPAVTIALDMSGGAFDDQRVRTAVLYALPKDNGILAAFRGEEVQCLTRWEGQERDARSIPYDPERAKMLLAESGYANGFGALLTFPAGDEQLGATGKEIAGYLGDLGIDVRFQPVGGSSLRVTPPPPAGTIQQAVLALERR